MNPTDTFARDGDLVPERTPQALPDLDPVPTDDLSRHVLIVEPSGWTYVAPHLPRHNLKECERVELAARVFLEIGTGSTPKPSPAPGRYWCSVSDDDVFEIGGRIS